MCIFSEAIRHVILEFTSVDVSFSMPKGSLSFSLAKAPIALIMSAVYPVLHSIAMPYQSSFRIALGSGLDFTFTIMLLF